MVRLFCFTLFCSSLLNAQTIPSSRLVDWSPSLKHSNTVDNFEVIAPDTGQLYSDGTIPNDALLAAMLEEMPDNGLIIQLPEGRFLFEKTIRLPSNVLLRGKGPSKTRLILNLHGSGDGIVIAGNKYENIYSEIKEEVIRGLDYVIADNARQWLPGQWVKLDFDDRALVYSDWASGSVGQILRIDRILGDTVVFDSALRLDIGISLRPRIYRLEMAENSGIECLSIIREDNTAPQQSSNILLNFAANCRISGIESVNCTFGHINISGSSRISVRNSYLHHGFEYGGGGRAYGVVVQFSGGENLIENNIFEHLRHSVLLQAGANGNVVSYNYSLDPYWSSIPYDAAGDMVLHGNYVYANLFEQNICQNIVIDNSHGRNGPFNTFFRNRAEKYGIVFSSDNSPLQNIAGNEITNTSFPYSLVNYTIAGADHFVYANNNKGTIIPDMHAPLPEQSLVYRDMPSFLSAGQFGGIGSPHPLASGTIPAYLRRESGNPVDILCRDDDVLENDLYPVRSLIRAYPNPVQSTFVVTLNSSLPESGMIHLYDITGRKVRTQRIVHGRNSVDMTALPDGVYLYQVRDRTSLLHAGRVIKRH